MTDDDTITGRDSFIVCKALAYAIAAILKLPPEQQEWSDMRDMRSLLDHVTCGHPVFSPEFYLDNAMMHLNGDGFDKKSGPYTE